MRAAVLDKGTLLPSEQEIQLADESSKTLSDYVKSIHSSVVQLKGIKGENISIPTKAAKLLMTILSQMAKGNAVTLIPVHTELTTQEAASLLNVSRPFLVNLLEDGQIPFRLVGTKRRVLAKDVLKYKDAIDKKRLAVLEDLAHEAQKHNMGY